MELACDVLERDMLEQVWEHDKVLGDGRELGLGHGRELGLGHGREQELGHDMGQVLDVVRVLEQRKELELQRGMELVGMVRQDGQPKLQR